MGTVAASAWRSTGMWDGARAFAACAKMSWADLGSGGWVRMVHSKTKAGAVLYSVTHFPFTQLPNQLQQPASKHEKNYSTNHLCHKTVELFKPRQIQSTTRHRKVKPTKTESPHSEHGLPTFLMVLNRFDPTQTVDACKYHSFGSNHRM